MGRRKKNKQKGQNRADPKFTRGRWSEGRQNVTVNTQGLGMPDRYETTLRYCVNFQLSGTATGASKVFNLNSLFDPDRSGTGGQPQNYDQIAAFYGTYWVPQCKWKVELVNANATVTDVAVLVSDDASTVDYADMIMQPRSWSRMLTLSEGGGARAIHRGTTKIATLHGQRFIEADPEDYSNVNASPSDTAVLIIDAQAHNGASAYVVDCIVTLDYDCVFMGRKRLPPSLSLLHNSRKAMIPAKTASDVPIIGPLTKQVQPEKDASRLSEFEDPDVATLATMKPEVIGHLFLQFMRNLSSDSVQQPP